MKEEYRNTQWETSRKDFLIVGITMRKKNY